MKNIKSPVPFFDTINDFKNPYRNPVKSITHLHENPPADALSDYQVASEFLYSYRGSNDTFSTYRRELEHFLHWSWIISGKSLKNVRREDIESYVEFARNPPANWIGNKNVSRFIEKQGEHRSDLIDLVSNAFGVERIGNPPAEIFGHGCQCFVRVQFFQ